ncbi:MAG: hypothetical protein P8X63_00305, partial [Desulfuromonadaceae bacterium]
IQFVSTVQSSKQTTYTTDFNLRYRILPSLTLTSVLELTLNDESKSHSSHSNLRWSPNRWISPSIGFNEAQQKSDGVDPRVDRSYSLTVPISPLPTLHVSLGAARIESYTGSLKTSHTDNYSLSSSAKIYPDLAADLGLNYATGGTVQNDGTAIDRKNLSGRFSLVADLSRRLKAELSNTYQKTLEPVASTGADSTLTLNYRPSDLLVSRLRYVHYWLGQTPDSLDFSFNLALLRTRKTRLNLVYRQQRDADDRYSFGLLGSWDISQIFSLQSTARYEMEDNGNAWLWSMKLFMRL